MPQHSARWIKSPACCVERSSGARIDAARALHSALPETVDAKMENASPRAKAAVKLSCLRAFSLALSIFRCAQLVKDLQSSGTPLLFG